MAKQNPVKLGSGTGPEKASTHKGTTGQNPRGHESTVGLERYPEGELPKSDSKTPYTGLK